MLKLYARERQKVGSGVKQPKYRVVAVTGGKGDEGHLKVEATHFRKTELEQIAADVGAEIIWLEAMPEEKRGEMKVATR
ncbi:hypothetical protein E2N92_09475 [Methanofollis formosanus]|uniref:Uncharacterized protein n=1 Tax=Methanofollis formosanus TaxID=299308 RepID=A0A8G1A3D0_9EURY|nr:hypothetical protein E2N92_09475 [Methanofollis formosanus]